MDQFTIGLFLSGANYALVNYIADPIRKRFPNLDLWWLVYVSLLTGAALSWLSGVDMFGEYIGEPIVSRVVTALAIGGGSNLLYQVFGKSEPPAARRSFYE